MLGRPLCHGRAPTVHQSARHASVEGDALSNPPAAPARTPGPGLRQLPAQVTGHTGHRSQGRGAATGLLAGLSPACRRPPLQVPKWQRGTALGKEHQSQHGPHLETSSKPGDLPKSPPPVPPGAWAPTQESEGHEPSATEETGCEVLKPHPVTSQPQKRLSRDHGATRHRTSPGPPPRVLPLWRQRTGPGLSTLEEALGDHPACWLLPLPSCEPRGCPVRGLTAPAAPAETRCGAEGPGWHRSCLTVARVAPLEPAHPLHSPPSALDAGGQGLGRGAARCARLARASVEGSLDSKQQDLKKVNH